MSFTMLLAGLALLAETALAAPGVPVRLDRGAAALESGRPVPLPNRPLPRRAVRTGGRSPLAPAAAAAPYVEPAEFGAIVEFDGTRGELERAGLRVGTQIGQRFTVRLRRDEFAGLRAIPGLRRVQLARYVQPQLDVSLHNVRADLEHDGSGSPPVYAGHAGEGIIIGDVDTGVDFTRPDFQDGTGKTRILYIWDQNDDSGTTPVGFSYGSEWTKSQIDDSPGAVTHRDTDGHGTNVAGVLIGNGTETGCSKAAYRYVGMAPLAEFIEVATDFSDAGIIDGVNYIFEKAAALGKPCVVNLSLGAQWGPHDGSGALSTAISALTGPGRIVVASSGNQGADDIHGRLTTSSRTAGVDKFGFSIPTYTAQVGNYNDFVLIAGWYDASASLTVRLRGPGAGDTLSCGYGDWWNAVTTGGTVFIANQCVDIANGVDCGGTSTAHQFEVEVFDYEAAYPPRAGEWTIDVVANNAASVGKRADIWIYYSQFGTWYSATVTTGLDGSTLVAEPGDADSVIAVGAYATKATWYSCGSAVTYSFTPTPTLGAIADFSNPGPRRDGVIKPELTAPGYGVATTHSSFAGPLDGWDVDDGVHEIQVGTSFSAPHVAGAAALLLETVPGASPGYVRGVFEAHARTDAFTGAVPNDYWGYGKLDVYGNTAPGVVVTSPAGGEHWFRDSTYAITWTAVDDDGVTSIAVDYSLHGRSGPWVSLGSGLANTGTLDWTLPASTTDSAAVRVTAADATGRSGANVSGVFSIGFPGNYAPTLALSPPWPNPLRRGSSSFTIGFTVPRAATVTLEIYDVGGGKIWERRVEAPAAGPQQIVWDCRNSEGNPAKSGVYFVRLTSPFGKRSTRLVLMR